MIEISYIISLLSALLTGGFLMLFIESQKLSTSVLDRFQGVMKPFYHKLSNYMRVAYYFYRSMNIDNRDDDERITLLKQDLDKFSKLCQEYDIPTGSYNEIQLGYICNGINNVWLYLTNSYLRQFFIVDSQCISIVKERLKSCIAEISKEYEVSLLNLDFFAQISGEFYSDIFKPVEGITEEYAKWQKAEKNYRIVSIGALVVTLVSVLLIILIPCLCQWFVITISLLSTTLFIWDVITLIRLSRLANKVCRA